MYTLGTRADPAHVLVPPAQVGAELVRADRGGDVTYHGPGQLVGYPIVTLPGVARRAAATSWRYVRALEAVLIDALADFGVDGAHGGRGSPASGSATRRSPPIGVKVAGGRTRHGFALNVDPDLAMFDHIVPCGIADRGVTSLARVLGTAPDDARGRRRGRRHASPPTFGYDAVERQSVSPSRTPTSSM